MVGSLSSVLGGSWQFSSACLSHSNAHTSQITLMFFPMVTKATNFCKFLIVGSSLVPPHSTCIATSLRSDHCVILPPSHSLHVTHPHTHTHTHTSLRQYSASWQHHGSFSYRYTHHTPFGNYSFLGFDACPSPGPRRPFNFFGILHDVS